jgi:ArsR family transcriptional regulator
VTKRKITLIIPGDIGGMILNRTVKDTAEIFKALGDETRLKIIKIIAATGNQICVGMIAHKLGVSQPAVSQHLKTLKNVGLITAKREGTLFHYMIVDDFLAPYGIDTLLFLKSFGAELDLTSCCEYKEKTETAISLTNDRISEDSK